MQKARIQRNPNESTLRDIPNIITPLKSLHILLLDVNKATNAWSSLAGAVFVPHTDEEYRRLVAILDGLIDEVGEDEAHPLASLVEIVGVLIEKYEDEHVPELAVE